MRYPSAVCVPATSLISIAACALKRAMPIAAVLLLLGAFAPVYGQQFKPVPHTSVLRPSSVPATSVAHRQFPVRTPVHTNSTPVNTGFGVRYFCASNVATSTCNYLISTVTGYYNDTFTNANADIYVQYGTTGLGSSEYYFNFVTYSQYKNAYDGIANMSAIQQSADTELTNYDGAPYGSDYVWIQPALAGALGIAGDLSGGAGTGIAPDGSACTLNTPLCFNAIVTVTNDPGTTLYYDDQGGTEPADAYDFYAVVSHETDEVLGTSSCVSTQNTPLSDACDGATGDTGGPSVVDLFRYSAPGTLVLNSSLSTADGAYFSYDGGNTAGAMGSGGQAKYYNAQDNGDDYADFVASSPDCGTNQAIQDATGCPGEDAGQNILNDGGAEVNILTAIGYGIPAADTAAALTSPASDSTLSGSQVTFSWSTGSGATGYILRLGTTAGGNDIRGTGLITGTSVTFSPLPTNGETIHARLYTVFASSTTYADYVFTAANQAPAALTSPAANSTLAGSNVTFSWSAGTAAVSYTLHLGTTVGGYDIRGTTTTSTSVTYAPLPTNGETIYARLYTNYASGRAYTDYVLTAANEAQAALISPAPNSTLPSSNVTFTWSAGTGAVSYTLHLGTTVGGYDIRGTTSTSVNYAPLPTNGETIYVRLYTNYAAGRAYTDYVLTAAP